MAITIDIKKQLIKIRELVARLDVVEKEVGEILNNYRHHILESIEVQEEREIMISLIKPLRMDNDVINRNLALILCDQLLEIL